MGFVPIELKANVSGGPRNQFLPWEGRVVPAGAGVVSERLRGSISAVAAAPFGVVSGQGGMARERDTSSRRYLRQEKKVPVAYAQCVISKGTLRDGGPLNEGIWLQL